MGEAISPQALSELIGSIYDCALVPGRWIQTLCDLREALDCQVAILGLLDRRRGRLLINKTVGMEPRWLEKQASYTPEINQMIAAFASQLPIDEPHILSRHVPLAYRQTSPYVQEILRPQGIIDIMEYFLLDSGEHFSVFAVSRLERQGIVTECEISLGGLLLPHLRRAVTISKVLDAQAIERAHMAETLDALKCGVVLTDEAGAILHTNRAAERLLSSGRAIQAVRGVLQANAPAAAKELRAAIRLSVQDEAAMGQTGLAIRLSDDDMPPVFAHVLPLAGGELRAGLRPDAAAAIFIGAPADEQDAADAVAAAFGLTPAETRVLANLLSGSTLAETAASLGIAMTTAKTHLDNIFQKTGVSRQAELMLLAARAAPPAKASAEHRP
jgi:DNA-binding CsgD family transcriptional regulator/PAS domain-containing protein